MNIKINKAPTPVGAYPHSKKVGNFLFLSGVGPRKGDLKEIPGVNKDEDGNDIPILNKEGEHLKDENGEKIKYKDNVIKVDFNKK